MCWCDCALLSVRQYALYCDKSPLWCLPPVQGDTNNDPHNDSHHCRNGDGADWQASTHSSNEHNSLQALTQGGGEGKDEDTPLALLGVHLCRRHFQLCIQLCKTAEALHYALAVLRCQEGQEGATNTRVTLSCRTHIACSQHATYGMGELTLMVVHEMYGVQYKEVVNSNLSGT